MTTQRECRPEPGVRGWRDFRPRPRLLPGALAARIRRARRRSVEAAPNRAFYLKFFCCVCLIGTQGSNAKEAVIFEQVGQLAGVTAYLHVHVELSISSVEAQVEKYQQLLRKHCSTEAAILSYMLTYVNASDYIRAEVYGNKPTDLPETSLV